MSHPDELPTGRPVVGERRSYGEVPASERIGAGAMGLHEGHTMLVALRTSGLCRAVAGCDLREDKRRAALEASPGIRVYENYADMLANREVEIVAIYTPDNLHADHIERAFRAGKDVICTKPLINDIAAADRLRKAARETGR